MKCVPMKISVIIPVFNKEKYLDECLTSAINQTLNDIEIICVNDGSTDASQKILEQYSRKDSRIKILEQNNRGPGSARNEGLKIAEGEYIFFLDADDWIELDALEKLYDNAKENESELVLFNAIEHLPEGNFRKRIYYPENIEGTFDFHQKTDIVMNNFLIVCTKLHKTDFLRKNYISFSEVGLFEDVFFHIKSIIKAKRISYLNEIFYNYRRTETNTRQSKSVQNNKSHEFLQVLDEIRIFLNNEQLYDLLEENYVNFKLTELKNLFENNEDKKEFFTLLNEDFNKNTIKEGILDKISSDKRNFYVSIKDSNSFEDYQASINKKQLTKSNDSNKIFSYIKGLSKKYFF